MMVRLSKGQRSTVNACASELAGVSSGLAATQRRDSKVTSRYFRGVASRLRAYADQLEAVAAQVNDKEDALVMVGFEDRAFADATFTEWVNTALLNLNTAVRS
jgi:hypothetical protein